MRLASSARLLSVRATLLSGSDSRTEIRDGGEQIVQERSLRLLGNRRERRDVHEERVRVSVRRRRRARA
jgi:hypothetical protein